MADLGRIAVPQPPKAARGGRYRAIAAIAAAQHGVVTVGQLVGVGMAPRTVRDWVASGRLHRIYRGVYAVGHPDLTANGHRLAAVLACGPGAVLSHRSAAALHGIRRSSAARIDVTAPRRSGRTRPGLAVHSADRLLASEITTVDAIPCTTVERTVVDLAGVIPPEAVEYAIHRAQAKRMLDRDEVATVLAHLRRRRGNAVVRRILRLNDRSEDQVRSGNERRLLRLIRAARLPEPLVNRWIALDGFEAGGVEVDLAWPAFRLAVEVDSAAYHATDRAVVNDPRRDRALMLAGWRVVRFGDRDLEQRPDQVVAQLGAFLRA